MIIRDVLTPECVCFLETPDKAASLDALVDLLAGRPEILDRDELARAIEKREALMSTGIGMGIAVPHVRLKSVTNVAMALGIHRAGLPDYVSMDDEPVRIIAMIAAAEGQHTEYIRTLAQVVGVLKEAPARAALLGAETPEAAFQVLAEGKA